MLENINLIITVLGSCISLLLCLGSLVQKPGNRTSRLIALLYLDFAIILCYGTLIQNDAWSNLPGFFYLHIPAIFFLGPLFLLYFQNFSKPGSTIDKWLKRAFFLPVLALIINTIIFLSSSSTDIGRLSNYFKGAPIGYFDVAVFIGLLIDLAYYFGFLHLHFFRDSLKYIPGRISALFFIFCTIALIMATASMLLKNQTTMHITTGFVSLLVILSYLISRRYPEFISEYNTMLSEIKLRRSLLTGIDLTQLEKQLQHIMVNEKAYQDEKLSLETLAIKAGLNRHQMSQYLNEIIKKNFKTYVNEFRINAAKILLKSNPESTILNIAFQIGFNSKSSFNSVFRTITGQTPSEYRKETKKA